MKIVITDLDHPDHVAETTVLERSGLALELLNCRSEEDLIAQARDAEIAINQYAPFTARVLAALPRLKQIIRYGVGVNNIDLDAATQAGVQVCNVPDYGMQEVSDHAIALTLAMLHKIVPMNAATRAGVWDYSLAIPVRRHAALTVGVIGLGRIGRLYAEKMRALKFQVIAHDPFPSTSDDPEIPNRPLHELLEQVDVVAFFCGLSNDTYHLLDAARIERLKDGAFVVNTARGGLIDERSLAEAVAQGRLGGAALDTTEIEPLAADSPLRTCESVLLTPHMAWYSEEAAQELKRKVAEEAVRFATNQPVNWPVNRIGESERRHG
jgi:D-3-phosphoglycerate dehydrogenase